MKRKLSPTPTGRVILERLEALSLSIAEIERRTPLTKNTISNAIYGPRQPQRKTIELLAEALELPIEALTRPDTRPDARPDAKPNATQTEAEAEADSDAPAPRFESFSPWLWRTGNASLWIVLAGLATMVIVLAGGFSGNSSALWVTGVHGAVILLLTTRLPRAEVGPRLLEKAPRGLRIAVTAAGDVRRYWGLVWIFWLVLYGLLTASAVFGWNVFDRYGEPMTDTQRWLTILLHLTQNAATLMIFLAYEVMARPTVEVDLSRKQMLPLEAWLAFALLPSVLETGVLLLGQPWAVQQGFGWFSGFAQGTALALLAGRLDSKYIGAPTAIIASLYVYAAIQGAWPALLGQDGLMVPLTLLALALKCLLFLLMEWLFESRILLYYLERLRVLDEDVRQSRRSFLGRVQ